MQDERHNIDICSYCLEYTYIVCQHVFADGFIKNVCDECYHYQDLPNQDLLKQNDNDQDKDTSIYFL